jgi:sterol desaturase/sphingolipid hydroxylase (fatty acid hydroxylase superfamily)
MENEPLHVGPRGPQGTPRLLPIIVPLAGVTALLAVVLTNWASFGYVQPWYREVLNWIWLVIRPEWAFGKLFYWVVGAFFLAAEYLRPARPLERLAQLPWDIASYILGGICYQLALLFYFVVLPERDAGILGDVNPVVRIAVLFLIADFMGYWLHRWRHGAALWPMHRWHHAPENMYWFSGNRTSPMDYLVLAAPSFITVWLFATNVTETLVVVCTYTFFNHWTHSNLDAGNTRWLEWLFMTPRVHRIHHSRLPEHYNSNYGVILTVWDRLFGTYTDPDTTPTDFPVGFRSDTPDKLRMMAGI